MTWVKKYLRLKERIVELEEENKELKERVGISLCSAHREYNDECGVCNPAVRAAQLWEEIEFLKEGERINRIALGISGTDKNTVEYIVELKAEIERLKKKGCDPKEEYCDDCGWTLPYHDYSCIHMKAE